MFLNRKLDFLWNANLTSNECHVWELKPCALLPFNNSTTSFVHMSLLLLPLWSFLLTVLVCLCVTVLVCGWVCEWTCVRVGESVCVCVCKPNYLSLVKPNLFTGFSSQTFFYIFPLVLWRTRFSYTHTHLTLSLTHSHNHITHLSLQSLSHNCMHYSLSKHTHTHLAFKTILTQTDNFLVSTFYLYF